jgi:hypothetical protein
LSENIALPANQIKAIESLLQTGNITKAAEAAGVTRRTIQRWMKDEGFKRVLREAESLALAAVASAMAGNTEKAVETLPKILDDGVATNSEKIQAARAYLGALPQVRVLGSIEQRISELENLTDES